MEIKLELMKNYIAEQIINHLDILNINVDNIAETTAISALSEIQEILITDQPDFDIVEGIVCVFEKYNLNFGGCHDF